MKHMRSIVCFLCLFLLFSVLAAYAGETEPEAAGPLPVSETPAVSSGDEKPGCDTGETAGADSSDSGDTSAPAEGTGDAESTASASGTAPGDSAGNSDSPEGEDTREPEETSESEPEPTERRDPMFGLRVGEEVTICVHTSGKKSRDMLTAAASDTVRVKVLEVYDYDHAGFGDGTGMFTNKYQVTFNGMQAVAYCLDPAKANPKMSDNFTILKYDDGKNVAKILYYAQADAAHGGYFALKHPGYNDEKQFIITHMAAAKAAGSSSWDQHANKSARDEANALILYAESMPAIQDPGISFSPSSVYASMQGSVLQTGKVTLNGSAGNTAVVTLPAGVTLKNQTDASRSGSGNVTIAAGDSFTLTYSTAALRSGLTVTAGAVGKQDRDYTAYMIRTDSDTQNLGLVFGEKTAGGNKASLSARFTPDVIVRPFKTDSGSGRGLQGAVFGLYASEDMTEWDGTKRAKGELIESVTTGADGKATFSHALTLGQNYFVREKKAPYGYQANTEESMQVQFHMESGSGTAQTMEHTFANDPVKGAIRLVKRDRELEGDPGDQHAQPQSGAGEESGTESQAESETEGEPQAQGDASLIGAVYGLYARKDILLPDQSGTVLYPAGEQVASAVTDEKGEIRWEDLPLGEYYVKEITPSEGYVLDGSEYEAVLAYKDEDTPVVVTVVDVTEQVVRQPFCVCKLSEKNNADPIPLAGAGFKAWLVSSLKKDGDSYDTSQAEPVILTEEGSTELFTDEKGEAVSASLPYGTYLVRETTVPENHLKAEDFFVHITEHSPDTPQPVVTLTDRKVQGQIRIVKTGPMLTGYRKHRFIYEVRGLAGAVFEIAAGEDIYRTDAAGYENGEAEILYTKGQRVASLTTDRNGEAVSEELPLGHYTVREVTAPYGMQLVTNVYEAVLSSDGETPVVVKDLEIEDPRQKVEIQAVKYSSEARHTPLKGAVFTLYAKENIYARSADGKTPGSLIVKAGTAVAQARSGKDGRAVFDLELPHAKYYVQETKAPAGYQLNPKQYECDCSYRDPSYESVRISVKIPDEPLSHDFPEAGSGGRSPRTGDRTPVLPFLFCMIGAFCTVAIGFYLKKRMVIHGKDAGADW